jgi:nucleoside-diphosphate-sugar epimerase
MSLSVLFIGGTGQISLPVVEQSVAAGHTVTILNRGQTQVPLPEGVETIVGAVGEAGGYAALADRRFDVVCQFRVYTPDQIEHDIATFTGKVGQYIFISSASAYQKPARHYLITEETPVENPFWRYSQNKADCEGLLRKQNGLPWTIVRPSHTVRTGLPIQIGDKTVVVQRILDGRPVVVAGDGTSLWTLTRSVDFARPFIRLFGNAAALGEDFHITSDRSFTWDQITTAIAEGLGKAVDIVHVPTDTLIRYNSAWEGPLLGDKSWSVIFDNTKVKQVAGRFTCSEDLDEILAEPIAHTKARPSDVPPEAADEDALMDRIVAEQSALGG